MIKNSFLSVANNIILFLISIIAQYYISHNLTQSQFGEYTIIISWISLISFLSLNSFNNIVTRAVSQGYERFFIEGSKICFISSFLASIILVYVGSYYPNLRILFNIAAISVPFLNGINLSNAYLNGKKKYSTIFYITTILQIIITTTQIFLVITFKTPKILLLGLVVPTAFLNLITTIYISSKISGPYNKQQSNQYTKDGLHLNIVSVISIIASKIQYIILSIYTAPQILAIYAVAQIVPDKTKDLVKSFFNPASVWLASVDNQKAIHTIKKSIFLLFITGLIIMIPVLTLLPLAINIVYGSNYSTAIFFSSILSIPIVTIPLNSLISAIIIYHNHKKYYSYSTISTAIIQIALFLILIPKFNLLGIAISIVATSLVQTSQNIFWLFHQRTNIQLESITSNYDKTINSLFEIISLDKLKRSDKLPMWATILAKLSFTQFVD
ncbi:MAG: polysaccharide biosynthesis C-terminal domain-containing protein [Candidatus Shapirobacteria bacterium]